LPVTSQGIPLGPAIPAVITGKANQDVILTGAVCLVRQTCPGQQGWITCPHLISFRKIFDSEGVYQPMPFT